MSEAQQEGVAQADAEEVTSIAPVTYTGSAVVLDPIEKVLVELELRHKDVVYDMTTTKGDKAARAARQELVKVRTGAAAAYKAWNAPLLDEQRGARERVAEIDRRVKVLEEPIDAQIKADEARREAERIERERKEAERIATIRGRIKVIADLPIMAVDMGAEEIGAVIDDLAVLELTEERYGEFLDEAKEAASNVATRLQSMHGAALAREEQAVAMRKQQEELERQRAEIAAQQAELARLRAAQEEADRQAAILREEAARQAADKAARDAEDQRRAQAGQTDAFAEEKDEARDVVKADIAEQRAQSTSVRWPSAQPRWRSQDGTVEAVQHNSPAQAPASIDDINTAAALAADDDVVDAELPAGFGAAREVSEYIDAHQEIAAQEAAAAEQRAADERARIKADAEARASWAPSAADIVDMLCDVQGVDAQQALAWLQAIDFHAVTAETLRHGQ